MKYNTDKTTGQTKVTPETKIEQIALEYLSKHRPIFAVAEEYVVSSFIAGYTKAIEEISKDIAELCEPETAVKIAEKFNY